MGKQKRRALVVRYIYEYLQEGDLLGVFMYVERQLDNNIHY